MLRNHKWSTLQYVQSCAQDWEIAKLESFSLKQKNSFVNGPFGSDLLSTELVDEGVPIIYIRDIDNGTYKRKSTVYVTAEKAKSLAACQTFQGDVIITKVGDPPCVAAVYSDPVMAVITQDVIRIKTTSMSCSSFLAQLINSDIGKRQIYQIKIDGTRERVSLTDFKKIKLPKPPAQEQAVIAAILSEWDDLTLKLQEQIIAKREHKRALMQRLLTGKLRFPEFADQPWHSEKFSNLIIARDERATANNTLPIMTSSRRGLMLQSEYFGKQVASEDTSNYKIIRKCDFTYRSMSDDRQFFFNQLDSIDAGIISPAYAVFYTHNVDDTFFKYFICSDVFSRHLDGAIQGGTRVALKLAALMSVEAKLPSLPEQRKIAAVLSAADREIDQLIQKLDAYKLQKKGLMQQLLTGKKRVNIPSSQKEKHYA